MQADKRVLNKNKSSEFWSDMKHFETATKLYQPH